MKTTFFGIVTALDRSWEKLESRERLHVHLTWIINFARMSRDSCLIHATQAYIHDFHDRSDEPKQLVNFFSKKKCVSEFIKI